MRPVAILAILAMLWAGPAAAGGWTLGLTKGRLSAEAVTLVGHGGVAGNRVLVYCAGRPGRLGVSFARRPGLPAQSAVRLEILTDAGRYLLHGRTNHFGVLVAEDAAAREIAALIEAAEHHAGAALADGAVFGPIGLAGARRAILRVTAACGARG